MSGKRHIFLLLCLCLTFVLNAQEARKHNISADFMALGVAGYNHTYKYYGGTDLKGVLHVDNTDVTLNLEVLSAQTYAMGLSVSPSFEVCTNGFVFAEGTLSSRIFEKYKIFEFVYAGSVGYKMRHFSAQVGLFSRTIDDLNRDWHSTDSPVTEPFNLLYKVKVSIMGFDHPWDIYLVGGNFNDYEYERMWEPIFALGGRWDYKSRWSALAEVTMQSAGLFHGTVKFYEATFRAGVMFKLK